MVFYILYRIAYFVSNILPLKAIYWLAERCADIHYYVSREDRYAVAENLNVVLKKDIRECLALARDVFRNFSLYLVDFFRMKNLDKARLKEMVQVKGIGNLDSALRQNKGVIALSCHMGNWELGGASIAMMGYDISAVVLTHRHKKINDFFTRQRERKGMKVISIHSIMKKCVSALLNKNILALVGDRNFTNSGVMLDLFGMPTSIPKGPAALSAKIGSPVVPIFCVRKDRYSYDLIFEEPIDIDRSSGLKGDEAIKNVSQKFIPIMEKYISAYPDQWFVFRRFWEKPEDAFVL